VSDETVRVKEIRGLRSSQTAPHVFEVDIERPFDAEHESSRYAECDLGTVPWGQIVGSALTGSS
jgi:hypothetical protein